MNTPTTSIFCVALQAELAPHTSLSQAVTAIEQSVHQLQKQGLTVREIGVDPRGLGEALIDALSSNLAPLPGGLPLPYPQTPKSAGNYIQLNGLCISEISRLTGISRYTFVDLLSGKQKGRRGNAHRAAVLLGLKPAPQVAAAGVQA